MFIATRVAESAKLRRGGMYSRSLADCLRAVRAETPFMPLLRSLAGYPSVVVTIDMALLTELIAFPGLPLC